MHYSSTDLQACSAHIAHPSRIPREKAARAEARRIYGVTCRSARTKAGALHAPFAYHLHAIYVRQDKHCEARAPTYPDTSIQMPVGVDIDSLIPAPVPRPRHD